MIQRPAHAPVGQNRHVHQHLVIDVVVALGGLDRTVQGQHTPENRVVENDEVLVCRALAIDDALHLEDLTVVRMQHLGVVHHRITPRRISDTSMRSGRKAARSTGTVNAGSARPHMNTSMAA